MGLHTEKPGTIVTCVANGAITKYRFIGYDDAVISTKGALAKGVSRDEDQDTTKSFACVIDGTCLVTAGEAVTAGEKITSNALGKAVLATSGDYINGIVMRDQATPDQLVEIRLVGNGLSTIATTTTTTTTTTTAA